MCSSTVEAGVVEPAGKLVRRSTMALIGGTSQVASVDVETPQSAASSTASRMLAVGGTSIFATFASQGCHNAQLLMQSNTSLTYGQTIRTLFAEHGWRVLYMGGSARIALLLLVNGLNEVLLKPAWEAKKQLR